MLFCQVARDSEAASYICTRARAGGPSWTPVARDALCPFPSRREGRLLCWVLAPAAWGRKCFSVTETIAQGLMLRPKLSPVLSSEQLCVCVCGG